MPVIEWLMTGVNAVLEAAILIPIISIMSVVLTMNSVQARDKAINVDMRDYMAFNQYDETHVYPQDITAVILSYRGFPSVKVTLANGTSAVWSTGNSATDYKAASINALLNQNTLYDSDIERNANGEVISVIFKPCNGSCGR